MGKPGQKVARVIETYELTGLGKTLADRWGHEDDAKRQSVRDLADYVNTEIVKVVLETETSGMTPSEYPPDRIAYLLAADNSTAERFADVPQSEIREVCNWLESEGVDIDELTNDFVTFGVVYDYLREYRNAEASDQYQKSSTPAELQETVTNRIEGLVDQLRRVVRESNRSLENANVLSDIKRDVTVEVSITCLSCGREYEAGEYVENAGCTACESGESESTDEVE